MLEWLFGKKEQKPEKKEQKKEEDLGKDERWIYDYVRQYLTSPIWRNPLLDFIEENCLIFDDNEENKFQYTRIFQEFTGLTALLLESMIDEVGIPEKVLQKCIIKGIKSEKDARIFQQILLCDNFLAFKKIMVSKNKELQLQALQKINRQSKKQDKGQERQIEIDIKELERLELEKAIAMSIAVSQKAQNTEQKQLEEAIRQSQIQYQKQESKKIEEVKKEEEKPQLKKSLLGPLPPLVSLKPSRPIEEYQQEQSKLKLQIEDLRKKEQERRIKEKVEQQDSEQRKKRLLQQRELIRKKKQDERKEQLTNFVQKPLQSGKLTEEELQRRRNLMKRLKQQLKE